MKFGTWNLFAKNRNQPELVKFLLMSDLDFACLQEVRPEAIECLKKSGLFLDYHPSYSLKGNKLFSAILGKVKPVQGHIQNFGYSLRNSIVSNVLNLDYARRCYQYNDYAFENKKLRLFNVHLPIALSPSERLVLLEEILEKLYKGDNVICGDFNSFGHFPWNFLLGPFNGSRWADFKMNEIRHLKILVNRFGLKMTAEKSVTYPSFRTHLDHILIPKTWESHRYILQKHRYGSDHKLVVVEASHMS